MSVLVGNPEDLFSHNMAHIMIIMVIMLVLQGPLFPIFEVIVTPTDGTAINGTDYNFETTKFTIVVCMVTVVWWCNGEHVSLKCRRSNLP